MANIVKRPRWAVMHRKVAVAATMAALISGCEKNAPTSPPPARDVRTMQQAVDSAAKSGAITMAVAPPSYVTTISVTAGDKLTITVTSNECSGNPESVNIYGVLSGMGIISGTCAGGLVGQTVTLGPAATDGTVYFTATHQEFGEGAPAPVTGSDPDYAVYTDDGCCGGSSPDYNDVILAVHVTHDPVALTCTPSNPTRLQNVSCAVKGTGVVVTKWTFTGPSFDGTVIWKVTGPTSGNSWKGAVVMSGDVTAEVTVNGKPRLSPLTAKLSVQRRTGSAWDWGPNNHWGYSQVALGSAPCPFLGTMLYSYVESTVVGQSARKNYCDTDALTPSPRTDSTTGYSVKQVPAGGPNAGIWYVSAISYQMSTWSMINPAVTSGSSIAYTLTSQTDIDRCKAGAGKTITKANFYFYNKTCAQVNVDAFISSVWNHEGRGCCSGNGHQAQLEMAANESAQSLYARNEGDLAPDQATARHLVSSDAKAINEQLIARWAPEPTGNISATIWEWYLVDKRFYSTFVHD